MSSDSGLCIAIEGLDGTGKSTIARLLAHRLNAVLVRNPPESLAAERAAADGLLEPERRAWYAYANRVAAEEARRHQRGGRTVLMDRCAASTVAFGLAQRGTTARPEDWPADVPRPDLILLLEVPETLRLARISSRLSRQTPEEARLRQDHQFRGRVIAGYRALAAVAVNAEGSPDEIVAAILRFIEEAR